MKRVIITGVSGQDGSYMAEYLLNNTDCEVIGAVRRTSQAIDSNFKHLLDNPRFRLVNFDLLDPHSIRNVVKSEEPDYFINFAAQTFVADSWDMPDLHFRSNAEGVLHILEAIRVHAPKCRFYNAGSSEQFGDVDYSPQDIKHPFKPRSPYGASKVAAHALVKVWRESYNLYAVQGLLFNHESERRQEYFVTQKIAQGAARIKMELDKGTCFKPLELGNLDAKRDWSHAEDFVDAIWRMLNQERYVDFDYVNETFLPKDFVIASGETYKVREFVECAFGAAGISVEWKGEGLSEVGVKAGTSQTLVKINPEFYRPAEVELLLGDPTEAKKKLDWRPKNTFKDLVSRMVKHQLEKCLN